MLPPQSVSLAKFMVKFRFRETRALHCGMEGVLNMPFVAFKIHNRSSGRDTKILEVEGVGAKTSGSRVGGLELVVLERW